MTRKMTVVFHDDQLYMDLKYEALKRRKPASEIVAEAVQEWLDDREDEELNPIIDARMAEYREKGGVPWSVVEREMEEVIARREKLPVVADKEKDVQTRYRSRRAARSRKAGSANR
ncbi:MAG: hypothetical protein A2147_00310 [Chloroflexi bacterium RBG_16_57_8]|nr:MAG: hypothetical protein A2147_00310 [Chloroflexi bacterium RBG_16_57_8]